MSVGTEGPEEAGVAEKGRELQTNGVWKPVLSREEGFFKRFYLFIFTEGKGGRKSE